MQWLARHLVFMHWGFGIIPVISAHCNKAFLCANSRIIVDSVGVILVHPSILSNESLRRKARVFLPDGDNNGGSLDGHESCPRYDIHSTSAFQICGLIQRSHKIWAGI